MNSVFFVLYRTGTSNNSIMNKKVEQSSEESDKSMSCLFVSSLWFSSTLWKGVSLIAKKKLKCRFSLSLFFLRPVYLKSHFFLRPVYLKFIWLNKDHFAITIVLFDPGIFFRRDISVIFFWDISVICTTVGLKLAVTLFTSLYFWPNSLNFFRSFKKNSGLWPKKNLVCGLQCTSVGERFVGRFPLSVTPWAKEVVHPNMCHRSRTVELQPLERSFRFVRVNQL